MQTVAVFSYGLRNDSRIKMKMRGDSYKLTELLLAMIYDRTAILQWYGSENGRRGVDPPEPITAKLLGIDSKDDSDIASFASGEDYEARRAKLLKGDEINGD